MLRLTLSHTRTAVTRRRVVPAAVSSVLLLGQSAARLCLFRAIHSTSVALSPSHPTAASSTAASTAQPSLGNSRTSTPATSAPPTSASPSSSPASPSSSRAPTPTASPPPAAAAPDSSAVWSYLYLPVKPPSSSSAASPASAALPVQSIKPPTASSLATLSQPLTVLPPPPSYASRPLPRLPLLLLALLAVPAVLIARDDWRAGLISAYPTLPWPQWMRVEATRLDRLSLEERRRRAASGWATKDDDSGGQQTDTADGRPPLEQSETEQQLEAAVRSLQALQSDSERWTRQQETNEQRTEREAKEAQRRSLLSSIGAMEGRVRDEMGRQQDELSRQVHSTEASKRLEFVSRLNEQAADITRSLARRLTEQRQSIAAAEQRKLTTAQAVATQQAREDEVSRGVQRITQRLQQQEEEAEAFVRLSMEKEERRLLAAYKAEADSKEAALQWAAKEERRLVRELDDVKQLQYVSANLHRLRLLLSSVDELLHHTQSSSPELWLGVWRGLRQVAADDLVIATAVSSITDASLEEGVQPFDELQTAFQRIERPLRAATLSSCSASPPSSAATAASLPMHVLSLLLSPFLLPQHSIVAGGDDSSRLSRACYYLYRSAERDIARCVDEMSGLQGAEAREAVSGWLRQAAERAAVEQAASVISTRLSTLELSLIESRQAA